VFLAAELRSCSFSRTVVGFGNDLERQLRG
jgi:hypothetical protein